MKTFIEGARDIQWGELLTYWGLRVALALTLLIIGLWVARSLANLLSRVLKRLQVEPILRRFLRNIAYAIGVVLVVVTTLDALGVPPTSLLAVVGAAGLAIGLAMKDSLSNIASGVMLIALRPFKDGDIVEIAGRTGVVEQVRLFQTVIRTFDNHEITLPNSQITGGPIVNFTARLRRRVDIPVGIGYDDDIRDAREALLSLARAHDNVLDDPAPDVQVNGLGDNSVNLTLRAWVNTPDFAATRSDLFEAVHREFDKAGISIPYPQRDVHLILPEGIAIRASEERKDDAAEK